MPHTPRLTTEVPNVENTIPIALYQVSSPERFSLDDDKFVLHGGGAGFSAHVSTNDPSHTLAVDPRLAIDWSSLSLYVLNTSFVIWSVQSHVGLELPYQAILLHALRDTDGAQSLYLQVLSSTVLGAVSPEGASEFTPTVVIEIFRSDAPAAASPLFAQVDASVSAVFKALSSCSALHFDSDDDDEPVPPADQPALEVPASWVQETVLDTTGNADDLEDGGHDVDPEDVAAMHVDVGYASIAGSVRKREHEASGPPKTRRLV